ncbi:MAG: ammonium transporter [SAR324 cluster bacterium]|nr:ammonium transporter [SAR324 cluster bacterium]MBL7035005.1 ammonium transporter [SAR324 cluster bacterium]
MEFSVEMKYVLDSFWLLISGCLVMWMAAGFAMLETGLVRTKNTTAILTKNICLYALACVAYYFVGYNLMYGSGNDFFGDGFLLNGTSADGHSLQSDFFFQVVFVATAASIVSGTVAERIKFWPFMGFTLFLTAVIYPIQGHWTWGGTSLGGIIDGFSDFAGSTIVHSVGGWAALAGVLLLGARKGKYDSKGNMHPIPGSNLPLATLGTFILWFGWFGFNGGSQLALGSKSDIDAISAVIANTNIAACAGALAAMVLTQLLYKKVDLTMILNGALSGLVAITAGPDYPSMSLAVLIGGIGGLLVVFAVPVFDRLKIDDPVGALSVHLVNGIWGTLAVGVFNPEVVLYSQIKGIVVIGVFTFFSSLLVWSVLKYSVGIRVSEEDEYNGMDVSEFGLHAYPEFVERQGI